MCLGFGYIGDEGENGLAIYPKAQKILHLS